MGSIPTWGTMIKNPTIKDFHVSSYVSWGELEDVFGKREYKKFTKWMIGQTCSPEGVYPWDLELYVEQKNRGIADPYVGD